VRIEVTNTQFDDYNICSFAVFDFTSLGRVWECMRFSKWPDRDYTNFHLRRRSTFLTELVKYISSQVSFHDNILYWIMVLVVGTRNSTVVIQ
jgi:hypothetical protein